MRYYQLILSFILLITFASALPLFRLGDTNALEVRASRGGTSKGGSGARQKEAKGIDKNISIQKQESKDVKKVQKAEGTKNFDKSKAKLNSDIKAGQRQRAQNQKTAQKSNKQLNDGLKKVQGAQAKEAKQAQSLKGNNSKSDRQTLKKLSGEFKDGRKQNEKNKQFALNGGKGGRKGN